MTKYETLTATMALISGWAIIFFGILASPTNIIPQFYKLVFGLADSISFVVIGVIFFRWEQFREAIVREAVQRRIVAVILALIEFLEGFLCFFIALLAWRIFTINNIPVVTYANLLCIAFFLGGIFLYYDAGKRLSKVRRMDRRIRRVRNA
jgi:hypothetical protein